MFIAVDFFSKCFSLKKNIIAQNSPKCNSKQEICPQTTYSSLWSTLHFFLRYFLQLMKILRKEKTTQNIFQKSDKRLVPSNFIHFRNLFQIFYAMHLDPYLVKNSEEFTRSLPYYMRISDPVSERLQNILSFHFIMVF